MLTVTGTPTFAFAAMSETWGAQIWSHTGQRNVWARYDGQMTQQKGPNFHWTHKAKKRICKTRIVIVAMFTKSQDQQRHSVAGESPLKVDPLLREITIRLGTGRASGSSSRHCEGSREVAACFTGPLKRLEQMEFWFRKKLIILILNKLSRQETPNSVGGEWKDNVV